MFEDDLPKHKIGVLSPLPVIDNGPFEFYRLVKDRIMLVLIPVGLAEFTDKDVERVFAPIDSYLDKLMERRVDIVVQSGVPLPALIGVAAHDSLIAHMADYTRRPATSSILGVVEAAKHLGIARIALANKWSDAMNRTLGEFFARADIAVAGVATKVLGPSQFQKMSGQDNIQLAYELGRQALRDMPEADGLYIGGGAWLSQPVAESLEAEFGRPVITNVSAMIRNVLTHLNCWTPIPGHGRLLGSGLDSPGKTPRRLRRGQFLLQNLRELDRHFRWNGEGNGPAADHKVQNDGVGLNQDADALGNQDRPRLPAFGLFRMNLLHLQEQIENFIQLGGRKGQAVRSLIGPFEFNQTHRAIGR